MEPDDLVERTAALMTTIDRSGAVLTFNPSCEEVCAIDRESARGRAWLELFVRPEDRAAVSLLLDRAKAGREERRFTAALPVQGGEKARFIRWQLTRLPPDMLSAIGIDVTDEREAGAVSRRTERIAALRTLTAGLAHELRNPLNAAHLQLDLARRRLATSGGDGGAREAVEVASAELTRLARLVDDFLVFARPGPLHLGRGDLRAVAEASVAALRAEASANSVELVVEAGDPVLAHFDDVRVGQAVWHLVRNAIEASDRGDRVRVAVHAGQGEATIRVDDSGSGLPAGARVFEPFYTTKPRGTGLGLSIVHQTASDHGGAIAVESRPGYTCFALSLPTH